MARVSIFGKAEDSDTTIAAAVFKTLDFRLENTLCLLSKSCTKATHEIQGNETGPRQLEPITLGNRDAVPSNAVHLNPQSRSPKCVEPKPHIGRNRFARGILGIKCVLMLETPTNARSYSLPHHPFLFGCDGPETHALRFTLSGPIDTDIEHRSRQCAQQGLVLPAGSPCHTR